MKKAYLIIAGMFFIVGSAFAQGPEMKKVTPEEAARFKTSKMLENGVINVDQVDKAYEIHLQQAQEMEVQREKMQAERDAIREKSDAKWDALLTKEQKEKREVQQQARDQRLKEKRDGMRNKRFSKFDCQRQEPRQQRNAR